MERAAALAQPVPYQEVHIGAKALPIVALSATLLIAHPHSASSQCGATQAKQSFPFIAKVWDERLWRRDHLAQKPLEAWHKRLQCAAGPGHLKALRSRWRASERAFYTHRRIELAWLRCPGELRAASEAYDVPAWILDGVEGAESGWGSGGSNLFGLIFWSGPVSSPYPAAKEAAHLLHDLYAGSWDAALYRYSGGGYGEAHVRELERGICP